MLFFYVHYLYATLKLFTVAYNKMNFCSKGAFINHVDMVGGVEAAWMDDNTNGMYINVS